jgi:preprotein translocase subunit SecG
MSTLFNLIIVIQVLSALVIIGLVLLQHGKGADMGAAFGSGASGSLFGATGSSNFLSKSTGVAAAVFFASTLALAHNATNREKAVGGGVMEKVTTPAIPATAPATVPPTAPAAAAPAAPAAAAPASSSPANQIPK